MVKLFPDIYKKLGSINYYCSLLDLQKCKHHCPPNQYYLNIVKLIFWKQKQWEVHSLNSISKDQCLPQFQVCFMYVGKNIIDLVSYVAIKYTTNEKSSKRKKIRFVTIMGNFCFTIKHQTFRMYSGVDKSWWHEANKRL